MTRARRTNLNRYLLGAAVALLALYALCALPACGKPATPTSDPMAAIRADAKTAAEALNAVGVIGGTALVVVRGLPNVPQAAKDALTDGVRAYGCALLDEGDTHPMPPPSVGTVSDSCHAHGNPMLGISSKINAAGSAATLAALRAQGLALAGQMLAKVDPKWSAQVAGFLLTAQGLLAALGGA